MALRYPLIAWGTPDDIAGGTFFSIGTPDPVGGQADPFGGTSACLLTDNDGAAVERRYFQWVPKLSGEVCFIEFVKQGTATSVGWQVRDITAGFIDRVSWILTWSTLALFRNGGSGRAIGVIAVGGGWYAVLFTAQGIVKGNTHQHQFAPAGLGGGGTGTAYWYRRNAVLLDVAKNSRAWSEPRAGSERVRGPDGGQDAWVTGRNRRFAADFTLIPPVPRTSPAVVSGWDGMNEATGVNAGVMAMLADGRKKGLRLTFVPDRTACSTSIASELVKPWDDPPAPGRVGDRLMSLSLRNPTTSYPLAA